VTPISKHFAVDQEYCSTGLWLSIVCGRNLAVSGYLEAKQAFNSVDIALMLYFWGFEHSVEPVFCVIRLICTDSG